MKTRSDYIVVGQIGSTYGIHGWLKVLSFTDTVTQLLTYTPWYIEEGNHWKPIDVTGSRAHGKGIVVKLSGFDTPEHSKRLAGKKIAVTRSQLPTLKKNEYYWNDLKGLTVINQRGEELGKVIYLLATGANDVLVVKGEKEHAIPYLLNDTIVKVDLEKQILYVNWEII